MAVDGTEREEEGNLDPAGWTVEVEGGWKLGNSDGLGVKVGVVGLCPIPRMCQREVK